MVRLTRKQLRSIINEALAEDAGAVNRNLDRGSRHRPLTSRDVETIEPRLYAKLDSLISAEITKFIRTNDVNFADQVVTRVARGAADKATQFFKQLMLTYID